MTSGFLLLTLTDQWSFCTCCSSSRLRLVSDHEKYITNNHLDVASISCWGPDRPYRTSEPCDQINVCQSFVSHGFLDWWSIAQAHDTGLCKYCKDCMFYRPADYVVADLSSARSVWAPRRTLLRTSRACVFRNRTFIILTHTLLHLAASSYGLGYPWECPVCPVLCLTGSFPQH